MAYSKNILPKASAYYTLNNASIINDELKIDANGSAEIQVSTQMLPKLTSKMLVVVHPSIFSNSYKNDGVQVSISIVTTAGVRIEYLIPAVYDSSGVFNTVIELPEETFASFTYKISSKVAVSVYNWELCSEEAVDVTTVIDGVEQALPRLLYDYNTYAYAVAQKELTVGLISCYLKSSTDLQGHFTLSFFATERCNVHVRIKDNSYTELFSPQVYTVEKGYSSISIPHAYLHKTATDHIFSVTIQCTNGQLSIPVRGLLYTIDGGYLATRLFDAGIDVEDLSIKQLPEETSPTEIYAIGFEGNRLILKSREYSNSYTAAWKAIKDFGEGLHAAVEFRGTWVLRRSSEKYTLETEESPYVFILDTGGTLRVYSGPSYDIVEELATEVSAISACQGFSSTLYSEQDQGTIIAYVKNGYVLYRSYIYNPSEGSFGWDQANAVYNGGDAKSVSVHRLPDYRVGICVEHSTGTKWYITDRTFVGQSVKPEIVDSRINSVTIATVTDSGKEPETTLHVAKQNVFNNDTAYHNGFVMTFDYALTFIHGADERDLLDSITVFIDGKKVSTKEIKNIDVSSNSITVELNTPVKGGRTVSIAYNCYSLVLTTYNGCYASIQQEYSWSLPLPITYTINEESIVSSVNGTVNASVKPLTYSSVDISESIESSMEASLTLDVKPTIQRMLPATEEESINLTGSLSLTVHQTGVSPV